MKPVKRTQSRDRAIKKLGRTLGKCIPEGMPMEDVLEAAGLFLIAAVKTAADSSIRTKRQIFNGMVKALRPMVEDVT